MSQQAKLYGFRFVCVPFQPNGLLLLFSAHTQRTLNRDRNMRVFGIQQQSLLATMEHRVKMTDNCFFVKKKECLESIYQARPKL